MQSRIVLPHSFSLALGRPRSRPASESHQQEEEDTDGKANDIGIENIGGQVNRCALDLPPPIRSCTHDGKAADRDSQVMERVEEPARNQHHRNTDQNGRESAEGHQLEAKGNDKVRRLLGSATDVDGFHRGWRYRVRFISIRLSRFLCGIR